MARISFLFWVAPSLCAKGGVQARGMRGLLLFLGVGSFSLVACDTGSEDPGATDTGLVTTTEDTGATMCDGQEVDLQTDKNHCGACDNACHGSAVDDPNLDLDTQACVAGECQTAWDLCADLSLFAAQSCESMCDNGCVQNGCNGETLLIKRDVPSIGIGLTCEHDTSKMQVESGYQCGDPLPVATASGNNLDLFSCCCAP